MKKASVLVKPFEPGARVFVGSLGTMVGDAGLRVDPANPDVRSLIRQGLLKEVDVAKHDSKPHGAAHKSDAHKRRH